MLEWVDCFNNRRVFGPLGHVPPAEFESMHVKAVSTPAVVAGLMNQVSGEPGRFRACPSTTTLIACRSGGKEE